MTAYIHLQHHYIWDSLHGRSRVEWITITWHFVSLVNQIVHITHAHTEGGGGREKYSLVYKTHFGIDLG